MYFVHPQIHPAKYCSAVISLLAKSFSGVKLNKQLSAYFPSKQFVFTDMGRSAFKLIIEKLNLQNSEMLFPAYICDIFYPIFKRYNIRPIFLDIDLSTFHIQMEEISRKITPKTKVILICHTYGLPFDVDALRSDPALAGSDLLIIEDCAHAFGIQPKSDAAFFSLYKQFPTLRGGMLVCPKDWSCELPKTSFNLRDFISFLNYFWPFALFFKKFGSDVALKIPRKEKLSEIGGINRASLSLFSDFLEDTEQSLENRKKLAIFFHDELKKIGFEVQKSEDNVFCYLSALTPKNLIGKRDEIVQKLKKYKVFCTRIWHTPIILDKEAQREYQVDLKEFPNTLEAAKRIINFPLQNHYGRKDVEKIIKALGEVVKDL